MSKYKQYIAPFGKKWALIGPDQKDIISVHPTARAATKAALKMPAHKGIQIIFRNEPVVMHDEVMFKAGFKKDKMNLFRGEKEKSHKQAFTGEPQYRQILYPTLPPEVDENRLKAAVKAVMAKTLAKASKY